MNIQAATHGLGGLAPFAGRPAPAPAAPPPPAAQDRASISHGAFREGVAFAAEVVTTLGGAGIGGAVGMGLGAVAATALAGPLAPAVMLGVGIGLAGGIIGGAVLGDRADRKVGEWGEKLAARMGASPLTGKAVGKVALALALSAPVSITLASATGPIVVGGAAIAGAFILGAGVLSKAAAWVVDRFRS